jgi:hypothetical protein
MASTPKQMKSTGYLPNAAGVAYLAGLVRQAVVKEVFLCNTDAIPQTVTIYYVPTGGAVGGSTTLYNAYTLQAGETQRFSTSTVLMPGDSIQWLASAASKIVGAISGIEYT